MLACKIVGTKNCMFSNLWVHKNVSSTHASRMMGTHNLCLLKCVSTKSNLYFLYLLVFMRFPFEHLLLVLDCGTPLLVRTST